MTKSVGIVGFGKTMRKVFDYTPDEIWTLANYEEYGLEHITPDRVFDMHQPSEFLIATRWPRLQEENEFPIYMPVKHDRIPSGVEYPLEETLAEVFQNLYRGEQHMEYMDSSFPYMVAMAVLEGYNPIYICGFEMESDTEYAYQLPGAGLILGWAAGRGTKVVIAENSSLFISVLYGYQEFQMISRQALEHYIKVLKNNENEFLARVNVANAQVAERAKILQSDNGHTPEELEYYKQEYQKATETREMAFRGLYMNQGASNILSHLIATIDQKIDRMAEFQMSDKYVKKVVEENLSEGEDTDE